LIGPFSVILLCYFKDGTSDDTIYNFVTMISFDLVFMTQGLIDQTYRVEQSQLFYELKETMWAPFAFWAYFMIY
jgi:hypothetical protein